MFYEFDQNNSGGSFDFDEDAGITRWVIVEAETLSEAITRAEEIGLYWNGCEDGIDCNCCGDRWYVPYEEKGSDIPSSYGVPLTSEALKQNRFGNFLADGKEACVHYADGRKEWY